MKRYAPVFYLAFFCLTIALPVFSQAQDWKDVFNSVYSLKEGEVLKRIPPPYIPERRRYHIMENQSPQNRNSTPVSFLFYWDGALEAKSRSFSLNSPESRTLEDVLDFALKLNTKEYDGSDEALEIRVPGDWIIRKDSSIKDQVAALNGILKTELKSKVQVVEKLTLTDVLVMSGQYRFTPTASHSSKDKTGESIYLFNNSETLRTDNRLKLNEGTIEDLISDMEQRLDLRIINESQVGDQQLGWIWKVWQVRGQHINYNDYFKNLSAQTALQFKAERRKMPVWTAEVTE